MTFEERSKEGISSLDNRFETYFSEEYEWGQYSSTVETESGNLEGGIKIPYALNEKGEVTSIELGSADYAHGLISGVSGAGKSTMLHMLINSVVMNYRPDDVEIWLVDYKMVEMSVYMKDCPPHIKFIGIERNSEFTFSLLDRITDELERRMVLFAQADRNIDIYKKKHGMGSIPRILLIIDEFHIMSQQVRENEKYLFALENLLAEGRAMGIICLFADLSIREVLNVLTPKGKEQMRMRLSMSNSKDEMSITLDSKISDIDAAMKNGEVLIKRFQKEEKGGDRKFYLELNKVIYLSDEYRVKIATKAKEVYGEGGDVFVVDGNKISEYDEALIQEYEADITEEREGCYLHLGKPSNFEKCFAIPLYRSYGENIVCISEESDITRRILLSAIKSFMREHDREIYIFADEMDDSFYKVRKELREMSDENETLHIHSEYDDICQTVLKLYSEMLNRRKTQKKNDILVFWFGLESILEEFSHYDKYQSIKEINKEKMQSNIELDSLQTRLEEKFASMNMFLGDSFKIENEEDEVEECLFNMTDQIIELIGEGSKRGIYQFVFYTSVFTAKWNKVVKLENFKYKISGLLSKYDCYDFFGNAKLMDSLYDSDDTLVCYDGIKPRFFLPYLMENK